MRSHIIPKLQAEIERRARKICILPVENRNTGTIANIIVNYVLPGAKIITTNGGHMMRQ